LWTVINSRITRTSRQLRRPDSRENGSAFSEQPSFSGRTVAFLFVRNEVEGPAGAAEKLSAFFVSASVYRRARSQPWNTGKAEMRTALIVAITLAQAASKGRVETQAQREARQQPIRDPSPASVFRRAMLRGSATDNSRGNPMQGQGCTMEWSGRRESNPRMQLGKLPFYH
jgi:hypothetical protein